MSEFHVTVVEIGSVAPHPNADRLDIVQVFDYPVITKRGEYKEGDLAVYVPIDSIVPDNEEWHWLAPKNSDGSERFPVGQVPQRYRIIEAKKLRGVFSQGCLTKLSSIPPHPSGIRETLSAGTDVAERMGITKYDPEIYVRSGNLSTKGEVEAPPKGWVIPHYTDIEGLRKYSNVLEERETVVITEKLHGCNARYAHDGERLWVGSRKELKKYDPANLWWRVAFELELAEKLAAFPKLVFFGEVFGQVQDLNYGIKDATFRVFDVFDAQHRCYLDDEIARIIAEDAGLTWVPTLYRGPWHKGLNELAEGQSLLAEHVREGFVVKPVTERWDRRVGRVILKRHGEGYLLRKTRKGS
jgi:RNA ligase (TIGR02306 family)